jgi:hypothetical protein
VIKLPYFCSRLPVALGKCGEVRINFAYGYTPDVVSLEFLQFVTDEPTKKTGYFVNAVKEFAKAEK